MEGSDFYLKEIKGNKQPIGMHFDEKPFDTVQVPLKNGDQIYLFSDGYPDQFGGEKGKKLKIKPSKVIIETQ